MNEKELAKKCLLEKWYPIRLGVNIKMTDNCAFCDDTKQRHGKDYEGRFCEGCYLDGKTICLDLGDENITTEEVIKFLEKVTGVI